MATGRFSKDLSPANWSRRMVQQGWQPILGKRDRLFHHLRAQRRRAEPQGELTGTPVTMTKGMSDRNSSCGSATSERTRTRRVFGSTIERSGDLSFEHLVRKGRDSDLELLANMEGNSRRSSTGESDTDIISKERTGSDRQIQSARRMTLTSGSTKRLDPSTERRRFRVQRV
jgi:hypothetical protein